MKIKIETTKNGNCQENRKWKEKQIWKIPKRKEGDRKEEDEEKER